jgi:PAS domain S-box-containing protein
MSFLTVSNKSVRILHVDDNPEVNFFLKNFFELLNPTIKISYISDPTKVVDIILEEEFDCIISDYSMPFLNGIELVSQVKQYEDIPFILYTGQGSEEVASDAFEAGVDDYIRKETDQSHFQVLMNRVLVAVEKHQTQKMFKDITEKSFDAIFTLDNNGLFTYTSPALTRMCGYEAEELVGNSFRKILNESDTHKLLTILSQHSNKLNNIELNITGKNRKKTILEVNLTKNMKNSEIISYQGIARDITEKKRSDQELSDSREHFRILFNSMVDPVVIVDKKGYIIEISEGVELVTGFKRDEILHHNFMDVKIVTRKSKLLLMKHLADQLLDIETKPYNIEVLTKDGRKLSYEINADKIQYKGKTVIMAVFRDRNIQTKNKNIPITPLQTLTHI